MKCNGPERHEMIRIVKGLDMCECSVSGWLKNLKGVVAEAREGIEREGGYEALRTRIRKAAEKAREDRKKQREREMKAWHSAGTYKP